MQDLKNRRTAGAAQTLLRDLIKDWFEARGQIMSVDTIVEELVSADGRSFKPQFGLPHHLLDDNGKGLEIEVGLVFNHAAQIMVSNPHLVRALCIMVGRAELFDMPATRGSSLKPGKALEDLQEINHFADNSAGDTSIAPHYLTGSLRRNSSRRSTAKKPKPAPQASEPPSEETAQKTNAPSGVRVYIVKDPDSDLGKREFENAVRECLGRNVAEVSAKWPRAFSSQKPALHTMRMLAEEPVRALLDSTKLLKSVHAICRRHIPSASYPTRLRARLDTLDT